MIIIYHHLQYSLLYILILMIHSNTNDIQDDDLGFHDISNTFSYIHHD